MNPLNVSFLQELMNNVADQGRALLPSALFGGDDTRSMQKLVNALVSGQGEASGVAIAQEILVQYGKLGKDERRDFFIYLAEALRPDPSKINAAAERYISDGDDAALIKLQSAVESPRQEFFRRLNLAPGATAQLVEMRRDLSRLLHDAPELRIVDRDIRHLFYSWFNRGFLILRRIDWQTPASILEKIMKYEAVHEIRDWNDLRRRLDPCDRRCFAFFHPALVDEPLIFVEVALMNETPAAIRPVLDEPAANEALREPTTAVFYSISNCQEGLKGISFGSFLIKQVVDELLKDMPTLKTFVTLSPVPRFARWLDRVMADDSIHHLTPDDRNAFAQLQDPGWPDDDISEDAIKSSLMALAAEYFLRAKTAEGKPIDPVARFHLGNGARLEQINWLGDPSEKGLREGHGLMVNYRYDPKDIETNHEAFVNDGAISASRAVRGLLRAQPKVKQTGETITNQTGTLLMLPGARTKRTSVDGEAD
ncbi:MAG: malonyl-CoA decarboxylase [Pseudomonadota bacterium]